MFEQFLEWCNFDSERSMELLKKAIKEKKLVRFAKKSPWVEFAMDGDCIVFSDDEDRFYLIIFGCGFVDTIKD